MIIKLMLSSDHSTENNTAASIGNAKDARKRKGSLIILLLPTGASIDQVHRLIFNLHIPLSHVLILI